MTFIVANPKTHAIMLRVYWGGPGNKGAGGKTYHLFESASGSRPALSRLVDRYHEIWHREKTDATYNDALRTIADDPKSSTNHFLAAHGQAFADYIRLAVKLTDIEKLYTLKKFLDIALPASNVSTEHSSAVYSARLRARVLEARHYINDPAHANNTWPIVWSDIREVFGLQ
jgi:hypothetical protein